MSVPGSMVRAVSRPKAHTGRATSTRKPKDAAGPKKATKTAAKTSTVTAKKPKTRAKPRTRSKSTSKTKTRAKPKRKPKKKGRKVLTEKQKADVAAKKKRSDLKALKELALKPPTEKPSTAWLVFVVEKSKGSPSKTLSAEYRNLSTEDREHYNHIANQNKAANAILYRQWVESHPVDVIHNANNARNLLHRRGPKHNCKWPKLHDDREVKRPRTSFVYFSTDRRASGDFQGIAATEATKRIAQEWKELPAAQRQPYVDTQKQDHARYVQEIKTVYNRDIRVPKQTA
ncbi:MAG: hypothetical protein Q9195_002956 [Heterodermia aff. obscurata]